MIPNKKEITKTRKLKLKTIEQSRIVKVVQLAGHLPSVVGRICGKVGF